MNDLEQENEFRSWKVLPARLDVFQTAWFLGFKPHDIPVLTVNGLLKPLGHPARICIKHYATETLDALRRDEKWLARASDVIRNHWHEKNARKHALSGASRGRDQWRQQTCCPTCPGWCASDERDGKWMMRSSVPCFW